MLNRFTFYLTNIYAWHRGPFLTAMNMYHIQMWNDMVSRKSYNPICPMIHYFDIRILNAQSNLHVRLHKCVSKPALAPDRCHAIIWTNAGILLIGPLGTNISEIIIEIHTFTFKKMHFETSSGKWRPFCIGLNLLMLDEFPRNCRNIWMIYLYRVTYHVCIFYLCVFVYQNQ